MVASAPSATPRQETICASARACAVNGSRLKPAAAAEMPMKRRRPVPVGEGLVRMGRPRVVMVGGMLLDCSGTQHIVARHVGKSDDPAAIFGNEFLRGLAVAERHGFVRAHPAAPGASDHEKRL